MLPEKRRIWTRRYSRSKVSRASRSGVPMIALTASLGAQLRLVVEDFGRQHVDLDAADPLAGREDDRPLDDVAQLADVARPVIGLQRGHRVGGDVAASARRCSAA